MSLHQIEYSLCRAVTGWTAWARRMWSALGFGQPEMLDLACLDQILHRPGHIFDGHVRVGPVLVKQIDGLDPQALERSLGHPLDLLWPAVQPNRWDCGPLSGSCLNPNLVAITTCP